MATREIITQEDIDNLADIIWWIKGYKAGADADGNSCPFGADHIESLRKIRANWKLEHQKPRVCSLCVGQGMIMGAECRACAGKGVVRD